MRRRIIDNGNTTTPMSLKAVRARTGTGICWRAAECAYISKWVLQGFGSVSSIVAVSTFSSLINLCCPWPTL